MKRKTVEVMISINYVGSAYLRTCNAQFVYLSVLQRQNIIIIR